MLIKYFKLLSLGLLLLVSGCFLPSTPVHFCESGFSVKKLPEATVNQPYSQEIKAFGKSSIDEDRIRWKITPENSGLTMRKTISKNSGLFEGLEIYGNPKFQGNVTIWIYWYGSSPPYGYFDKTFILKVNAPAKQDIKD